MDDSISRKAALDEFDLKNDAFLMVGLIKSKINNLPPVQPEIIRCKDCKFYTPMNRKTQTGICNLLMHQNFGDDWFCAGAERKDDGIFR